ncbi:MAG: hypothetical protein D6732_13540, partial [Methanobacteriota archaeon]
MWSRFFVSAYFFWILNIPLQGQQIYYVSHLGDLYLADLATCDTVLIWDMPDSLQLGADDLTSAPDGYMYILNSTSNSELYRVDTATNFVEHVITVCVAPNCSNINGMTADYQGNIYMAGNRLYVYNIYSQSFEDKGPFPAGISSAGDLTFRNDSLIMSAKYGKIVLVDIDSPQNSEVLFTYSTTETGYHFFGITTLFYNCDSLLTVASTPLNDYYLLDFQTHTIHPYDCEILASNTGLTTAWEWQASGCDMTLSLDADGSSLVWGWGSEG